MQCARLRLVLGLVLDLGSETPYIIYFFSTQRYDMRMATGHKREFFSRDYVQHQPFTDGHHQDCRAGLKKNNSSSSSGSGSGSGSGLKTGSGSTSAQTLPNSGQKSLKMSEPEKVLVSVSKLAPDPPGFGNWLGLGLGLSSPGHHCVLIIYLNPTENSTRIH